MENASLSDSDIFAIAEEPHAPALDTLQYGAVTTRIQNCRTAGARSLAKALGANPQENTIILRTQRDIHDVREVRRSRPDLVSPLTTMPVQVRGMDAKSQDIRQQLLTETDAMTKQSAVMVFGRQKGLTTVERSDKDRWISSAVPKETRPPTDESTAKNIDVLQTALESLEVDEQEQIIRVRIDTAEAFSPETATVLSELMRRFPKSGTAGKPRLQIDCANKDVLAQFKVLQSEGAAIKNMADQLRVLTQKLGQLEAADKTDAVSLTLKSMNILEIDPMLAAMLLDLRKKYPENGREKPRLQIAFADMDTEARFRTMAGIEHERSIPVPTATPRKIAPMVAKRPPVPAATTIKTIPPVHVQDAPMVIARIGPKNLEPDLRPDVRTNVSSAPPARGGILARAGSWMRRRMPLRAASY